MELVAESVTRHTPAPWHTVPSHDGTESQVRTGNGLFSIYLGSTGAPSAEWAANASLIAAAPDLLMVARYILATYDQQVALIQRPGDQADITRLAGTIAGCHVNVGINVDAFADQIRAIVAKAEGR